MTCATQRNSPLAKSARARSITAAAPPMYSTNFRAAGAVIVADTCVVVTPILPSGGGVLMTNSGKFAHYGPANLGYDVVYGSLEDCVASAVEGRVCREERVWQ